MNVAANAPAAVPAFARSTLRQLPGLRFTLHAPRSAERAGVESYVRARFAGRHGARITHFLADLVTLGNERGPCAAVGISPATSGPLFAEIYLDEPIERCIARHVRVAVSRHDVLEIGNLVSTWRGGSLLLFVFLSELVVRLGHRWVVFTATREVEALLGRLGYAPIALAQADPARLPDAGAAWGTYYGQGPRVVFGEVPPAVAAARRSLSYRLVARLISSEVDRVYAQLRERTAAGGR